MAVLPVVGGTPGLRKLGKGSSNGHPCSCHVKDQSSPVGGNADVGHGIVMRRFRSGFLITGNDSFRARTAST